MAGGRERDEWVQRVLGIALGSDAAPGGLEGWTAAPYCLDGAIGRRWRPISVR